MRHNDQLYTIDKDGNKVEEPMEGTITDLNVGGATIQSALDVVRFVPMARVHHIQFAVSRNPAQSIQSPVPAN